VTRVHRRLGRSATVVVGLALAASAGLSTTPVVTTAHATSVAASIPSFDSHLLAHINKARARHGLVRVSLAAGTTDVAHGWTCGMADRRLVSHNLRLGSQLETHGSPQWRTYGENVAAQRLALTAGQMFRAYMKSPEHRANILDPSARFVGIWSKRSGHWRYNTIDFVGSNSGAYDSSYGAPRRTC
jgi:uncharacterized protein YkwD